MHFELQPSIQAAARLVGLFYGKNLNYYLGRPKKVVSLNATDFEAECYISLISTVSSTRSDDRRATIELQTTSAMDLLRQDVMAVVLPETFMDDPEIANFVSKQLSADAVTYESYHAPPSNDTVSITEATRTYLRSKGLL